MEKKRRVIIAVLLMISVGNFARLANNDNIRAIQFVSIFVIGALSALLLNEFVVIFKTKKD